MITMPYAENYILLLGIISSITITLCNYNILKILETRFGNFKKVIFYIQIDKSDYLYALPVAFNAAWLHLRAM